MTSKNTLVAITTLVVIAATIYGVLSYSGEGGTEIQVQTVTAGLGEVISTVTATGTLQPLTQVEVGTQVSGEVEKIYVDFNSEVNAGELIAELDKTNLKAEVAQAKASLQNARNEVTYREGIFNRKKALFDQNLITEEEYELALYNYNTAKFSLSQRESDLEKAQTNLGYADIYSPISGVVLSREVDEGQTVAASMSTPTLFNIAKDLKEMQVEADVDEADIGQVKEGQRVSFTVDAYQGEEFDGTVTQVRLNPTTTSNVVTYTVVVNADNSGLKLKPGMTATITIYTQELQDILTIQAKAMNFEPEPAILSEYYAQEGIEEAGLQIPPEEGASPETGNSPEGGFPPESFTPGTGGPAGSPPAVMQNTAPDAPTIVYVQNAEGLIVPRPVKLGANDGINVEVISGLNVGDEVVYRIVETEVATDYEEETRSPFMPGPPR
tara:strand:+ start:10559 stop:11875 length:1317 start_codon:yes stop_codon:yes gene_type:complete